MHVIEDLNEETFLEHIMKKGKREIKQSLELKQILEKRR